MRRTLLLHKPSYVFPNDIKFQVDNRPRLNMLEVGVFHGVRNNSHRETSRLRIKHS